MSESYSFFHFFFQNLDSFMLPSNLTPKSVYLVNGTIKIVVFAEDNTFISYIDMNIKNLNRNP